MGPGQISYKWGNSRFFGVFFRCFSSSSYYAVQSSIYKDSIHVLCHQGTTHYPKIPLATQPFIPSVKTCILSWRNSSTRHSRVYPTDQLSHRRQLPPQNPPSYMTTQSIPYIALSTLLLTWYQSALRCAYSYTSSARNTPPNRSPSAMTVAISLAWPASMR